VVPALRLILAQGGQPADESHAADFMRFTARRGISLTGVWVVPNLAGDRLLWASLPMVSPGRTLLMFAAPADVTDPAALASGVDTVCRYHGERGIQLAQALLDPADSATADAYVARSFEPVAELLYLQKTIRKASPVPAVPKGLRLATYSAGTHAAFARGIQDSYQESLDCPPLNGVRDIEDVIAGHKSAGEFDPDDWFVLTDADDASLGVLLLSRTGSGDGMELVYLGLAPAARGRGLGDYLFRQAEARAAAVKMRLMSLAVDSINAPAIALYHRHGMQQIASKRALMRRL
jgi:ribosomal protein S18 acetylase RimI-like enzyme